jgi:lipoprotein-releasing system permease protein
MNWKLAFNIASTHLLTKKKQSVIAMLGVTFGISMFIIMISFMTGVNDFLEDMAMDNTPHLRVYKPIQLKDKKIIAEGKVVNDTNWFVLEHQRAKKELTKIKNGLILAQQLSAMPEITGVAPQVSTQVFFNNGPTQIPGTLSGIDIEMQKKLFELDKKMDDGAVEDLLKGSDVIIVGKGLAKKMNVKTGDRVSVTTPEGNNVNVRIVGIFSFGIAAWDETKSYATLATVQKVMGVDPSYITELHMKLKDKETAKAFKEKLAKQYPNIYLEDWETANASILAGTVIRNVMTIVVCLTLLIVAGFGIYNIMNMNIINKMKDIAILKATGFESGDITGIFLLQSLMIGIAGGIVGLLIGFGVSFLLSHTPFPAGEVVRMKTFPVNFKLVHYMSGLFFGFLTTLFAGYFPSKRAAKIDPVQIIRG